MGMISDVRGEIRFEADETFDVEAFQNVRNTWIATGTFVSDTYGAVDVEAQGKFYYPEQTVREIVEAIEAAGGTNSSGVIHAIAEDGTRVTRVTVDDSVITVEEAKAYVRFDGQEFAVESFV